MFVCSYALLPCILDLESVLWLLSTGNLIRDTLHDSRDTKYESLRTKNSPFFNKQTQFSG